MGEKDVTETVLRLAAASFLDFRHDTRIMSMTAIRNAVEKKTPEASLTSFNEKRHLLAAIDEHNNRIALGL